MSKRKLEDDIICNITEEDRAFKPKVEILSVDADSSCKCLFLFLTYFQILIKLTLQ